MADLADSIDDLICAFDKNVDYEMDTLAMFLFGWILISLIVLWVSKAIYGRYITKDSPNETKRIEVIKNEVKSEVKDNSVKKIVSSVSSGRSTGGYVPPQAPLRKRLSRRSPVPDFKKSHYYPAPQCTGADNIAVLWVNDVFQWLYNDLVIVNELLAVWLQSMNDFSKQTIDEHGIGVEFVRILPESLPPVLTNVFCECASNDDVTITCDCESTPALQIKCSRQVSERTEISHYRVNVNRFRARLNLFCVTEKLQAELKCDGWPDIKVLVNQVGNIKNNPDESQLQDLLSEIVINAMRSTQFHMNLAQYPTCPRLVRHIGSTGPNRHQYDGLMDPKYHSTPNHKSMESDKRLLVKVIRAAQLGNKDDSIEPFCVVEMDDPPQKNQTSIKKHTSAPFWDEHFLFDLSPTTAEIMFEIFDHAPKPHKFLGLGIVGVEELLISPSQRQVISLQSRPYESDPVSGSLTVEFMFIEGADIPMTADRPYKLKETLRTISPTGALVTTTKTTFANGDTKMNGENLTDSALKELEISKLGTNPNKSTLIIHSVQRHPSQRLKVELVEGTWKQVSPHSPDDTQDKSNQTPEQSPPTITTTATDQPIEPPPRGRSRRKRDFFGTIKRRLGRSKTRSRSAGPEDDQTEGEGVARSISADRGVENNEHGNTLGARRFGDENSRRSSLSEASGVSGASTRTYIHEASTLVLEAIENGVKKHYLVPLSLAQKTRWRKKGVKLHVYNDHTFVAKHLSGGTICQICNKQLARRLGKQGYECRDCLLKCHKHCHVKVINNCATSTIHNIELSYISNPYTDKNIRML